MHAYYKIISIILVISIAAGLSGCSSDNKSVDKLKSKEYKELIGKIGEISPEFSSEAAKSPIVEEFIKADDKRKAEIALNFADDMAQAQFFGIVSNDILTLSGEAVKAYPHPLLLNNYAALLLDTGNLEDSLYFFQKAEVQDAENPVLLTNIANVFLELGDFAAAESYAQKALAAAPDFGAAYQVLTTVNLQKQQYKLAAQYLLMSAKHCFNDITVYQFESFLDAVQQLNPEEDEYPLEEQFLNTLHEIAIKNIDTKDINDSVDTPGAQVKIKPFPQIGSADNLMKSYDYLVGEREKSQQKYNEVSSEIMKLSNKSSTDLGSRRKPGELVYPVEKNLRQIYAFKVLQSYYEFKLKQRHRQYINKIGDIQRDRNDEIKLMEERYQEKRKTMGTDPSLSRDQLLIELFSMFDTKQLPDVSKYTAASVNYQKVVVEEHREKLDKSKMYATVIVSTSSKCYNDTRQLLEEFWLKAGGLLKCFADEDTFRLYDLIRQQVVYSYISVPVMELENHSSYLNGLVFNLRMAEETLKRMVAADQQAQQAKKEAEAAFNGGDTVPDIEKEAIAMYQEKNDLGAIGGEVEAFGFSGSVQYTSDHEGDVIKLSAGAPFGGIGGDYNIDKGKKNAYAVHGVTAMGDTGWFEKTKTVQDALGKTGKAGKALGSIGLGFSQSKMSGQYAQTDSHNNITDRGVVYVRESSGSIGPISKTEKVEVRKSLMTGVAFKQTTTKYKFMFVTYEK